MKVTTYCINKGTASQYFGLKNAEENTVLHHTPTWKIESHTPVLFHRKHCRYLLCVAQTYRKGRSAGRSLDADEMCEYLCNECNLLGAYQKDIGNK